MHYLGLLKKYCCNELYFCVKNKGSRVKKLSCEEFSIALLRALGNVTALRNDVELYYHR